MKQTKKDVTDLVTGMKRIGFGVKGLGSNPD
jgi:hypothetical protein